MYLIKDDSDRIASYFSIKCGLLYSKISELNKLPEPDKTYATYIMEALRDGDQETLTSFMSSTQYTYKELDNFHRIALDELGMKKDDEDKSSTYNVTECYSAIELRHFCRNSNYSMEKYKTIPLGFGLFWEVIVPNICKITNLIGCKYVYLFAADKSDCCRGDDRKLVNYYKRAYKFDLGVDQTIVKPAYDDECFGLIQEISQLKENRTGIWKTYIE